MKIHFTVEINPEDVDQLFSKFAQILSEQVQNAATLNKEYYTISEVAAKLNIKQSSTLYNHIRIGLLKADKVGKTWQVNHKNLQDYVQKNIK